MKSESRRLILASRSPRRCEILAQAGLLFTLRLPAEIDETPLPGERPRDYVMRLAREKARTVTAEPGATVLGADTAVVVDDEILGKPRDAADAERMLRLLSGRRHDVITGICLRGELEILEAATTNVWFSTLSDEEIRDYIASGEPMDKAGAYGIQGLASKFIERLEGCYFNVVGLPVALVYQCLRR